MKFSEMKYERPDLDKVLAQCEEYAKKMAAAQSGEELVQLYREENAMMAHYHTASCLASIHYTQDTRDEYWSGEQEWFDATGPAVSNAARNVAEAILSNPHAKALEEAFGTRILPSLRNLVLSMDDRVIELQKEENALTSAYQKLYGGAMAELDGNDKVKVLLAQALFGNPDILLLDEPTNNLDNRSVAWLEDFLMNFPGTLIVVSHDRWFLNNICTHIVDIDFNQVKLYVGNYDFWYESSKMMQSLMNDQKKRREDKIKELQAFIQRFSSNKSKAKQATSRRKLLDQLTIEQMPASSRRYPWVCFTPEREAGKDILQVSNLNYTQDGVQLLKDVSFIVTKGQKIALVGSNEQAQTALFRILAEEIKPDSGSFKWGVTISTNYFPKDNSKYFDGCNLNMMQWFAQYSPEQLETYMRGFLGRMLFSGDDVYKPVSVLSGGEKVRVMLSRMMLSGANFLMLDQPTNHLDLESITAVNNALINFPGNVIFTSQDHQFITTIADRIIEIKPDGTIADYYCGYEDYLEKIRAQEG